jgi:50S ribosomal protein L16 3-hydroxylase
MKLAVDIPRFLRDDWQKCAVLWRQALPGYTSPIDGNDLAALATEEEALARLVQSTRGKRWQLRHGPFTESDFAALPPREWTLLVQDVDKWLPQAFAPLLGAFRFLPRWRIEDVMVSYAVAGGSVGPHVDQYDVFLLQAAGRRRWQIDTRPDADRELDPRAPLKLLKTFTPDQDWVLEPGDILYLPPGVPHHGVAVDECLTFSIGLRAPSASEVLHALASKALDNQPDAARFRDPDLRGRRWFGELDAQSVAALRAPLQALLDATATPATLARFLSAWRAARPLQPRARALTEIKFGERMRKPDIVLVPNPWQRLCWTRHPFSATRAELHAATVTATLPIGVAEQLCAGQTLGAEDWAHLDGGSRNALHYLYAAGVLDLVRRDLDPH